MKCVMITFKSFLNYRHIDQWNELLKANWGGGSNKHISALDEDTPPNFVLFVIIHFLSMLQVLLFICFFPSTFLFFFVHPNDKQWKFHFQWLAPMRTSLFSTSEFIRLTAKANRRNWWCLTFFGNPTKSSSSGPSRRPAGCWQERQKASSVID